MLSTRITCTIALATALSMPCFAQSTSGTDSSGTGGTAATTGTTTGATGRQPDAGHRVDTTRTSAQR